MLLLALAINVVLETAHVLVVDKPPGPVVHGEPGSVLDALRAERGGDFYPAHRLDAVTSGLLVFGKSKQAARELGALWEAGGVAKGYVGLAAKPGRRKRGRVSGDMARAQRGKAFKLLRTRTNPAVTDFVSLGMGEAQGQGEVVAAAKRMFLCRPVTGQTHQIRVALKSNGAALLGDALYAGAASDRVYLHAAYLAMSAGICGEAPIELVSRPSVGAEFASERFRNVWDAQGVPGRLRAMVSGSGGGG
jgi:tRNA pseudouridine32 synthase/23S rRNA pseudouridine746 synthase